MAKRWKTRKIHIGNVGVGGENPIRIQSMTTSPTSEIAATVDQIIRLADEGCEIARVTVQGMKEAKACEAIKNQLLQKGYTIPLVADIHFFPPAAMYVADFVDKVRVNPGNYADKRAQFKIVEYDDTTYARELERLDEKFSPLVLKCKSLGCAVRIGTNHGSLSDRVMNRYGDTATGMVKSAIEFADVCRKHDYHNFLFSMKASNVQVMIEAYRLLVAEMIKLGWNYPLHLGVTEAGEGEDGRIKSAMGIGSLLLDGIGDTVRISLTEDCWKEISPCKRLVAMAKKWVEPGFTNTLSLDTAATATRRTVSLPELPTLHRNGTVMVVMPDNNGSSLQLARPTANTLNPDLVLKTTPRGRFIHAKNQKTPLKTLQQAISEPNALGMLAILIQGDDADLWHHLTACRPALIVLSPKKERVAASRTFFAWLKKRELAIPVLLHFAYSECQENLVLKASAECGALLCDGLGEGICIEAPHPPEWLSQLGFAILQAARMRMTRTDFISCPSCGRTLFDLQKVTANIRKRTSHLAGVKIAVMGCIVNGPGEMADADFGYVGSKQGMIDLYVGKTRVKKNIPSDKAVDHLIALIKAHDRWEEPATTQLQS